MKVEVFIRAKQNINDAKPCIHLRKFSNSMNHAINEIKSIYKGYEFVRVAFYSYSDNIFIKSVYLRYGHIYKPQIVK